MKSLIKATGMLTVILSFVFVAQAHALQVVKTNDLQLSVGGLVQVMGDLEYISNDKVSNPFRVYLWNTADSLYTSGSYKGFSWRIGTMYGGTANFTGTHTNGLLNLTDAYVNVPLVQNALYLKVGQFKDPSNFASATDSSDMLFTEKSPNFNLFFNSGYEMGVAFVGNYGGFDGAFGVVQGAPNLPQRYLPEQLHMPVPMFLRVGYSNGITDHPFHQMQTVVAQPKQLEYAVHLNGFVAADSRAGHGDLFGQMGSALSTFGYNQDYSGNVLLSSLYNPYLTLGGGPASSDVKGLYSQASADFQVRVPFGNDSTIALQGQGTYGYFTSTYLSGDTAPLGTSPAVGTTYKLNIYGGELIASLQQPKWAYAARLAVVVPDAGLVYGTSSTTGSGATAVTTWTTHTIFPNTNPIWEVTPSVTYTFNQFVKLTTEVMMMFNEPESVDIDGNYVVALMPSQSSSTYANIAANFIPIGRMMLQLSF